MKTFTFEKINEYHGWIYYNNQRMLLSCEEASRLQSDRDLEAIWDHRWVDVAYT